MHRPGDNIASNEPPAACEPVELVTALLLWRAFSPAGDELDSTDDGIVTMADDDDDEDLLDADDGDADFARSNSFCCTVPLDLCSLVFRCSFFFWVGRK